MSLHSSGRRRLCLGQTWNYFNNFHIPKSICCHKTCALKLYCLKAEDIRIHWSFQTNKTKMSVRKYGTFKEIVWFILNFAKICNVKVLNRQGTQEITLDKFRLVYMNFNRVICFHSKYISLFNKTFIQQKKVYKPEKNEIFFYIEWKVAYLIPTESSTKHIPRYKFVFCFY